MTFTEVSILSLVEGLTEFLPVSSTGHLIMTSWLFGIQEEGFVKSFNIIIQFGAILSVVVLYWRRFLPNLEFYKKLIISFLPAAIIGLLVKSKIDAILGSPTVVASSFILGGFVLIWSDRFFKGQINSGKTVSEMTWQDCVKIGFAQCFAFIPGVSRSAASIIGGLYLGMNRREAAEFSFFLAVPTLTGAALVKSLGAIKDITPENIQWLVLGCVLSFIFAMIAIKFIIHLISRHGFKYFGIYRIIIGVLIFFLISNGKAN